MFAVLGQTPGRVSLMRSLKEEGPQSVAQLARSRSVARQGVQRMGDELTAAGLIAYVPNPAVGAPSSQSSPPAASCGWKRPWEPNYDGPRVWRTISANVKSKPRAM